jgi:hypothetical protein
MRKSKMPLNEQTKSYMLKMVDHFNNQKLVYQETQQLFQDLVDSELIWELPQDIQNYAYELINERIIKLEFKEIGEFQ